MNTLRVNLTAQRITYWQQLLLASVLPVLLLGYQQARFFPFFIDDSYISLVYVRNLIEGNGLTYNGMVVEGYSNFLWVMLVSFLSLTGLDPVLASKVLGMLCSYGCVMAVVALGHALTGRWVDGIGASFLLAASGPFIAWSVGGLEGTLLALLLVLLVLALHQEQQREKLGFPWSAVIAVLMAMTRPEAIGLVGLAWLWLAGLYLIKREREPFLYLLHWSAVVATGFGLFLLWRFARYHDILPATVYAKRSGLTDQIQTGMARLSPLITEWRFVLMGMAVGLVGYAIQLRRTFALLLLIVALIAGYVGFVLLAGSDWMPMHRFLVPIFPLSMLLIAGGVASLSHLFPIDNLAFKQIVALLVLWIPFSQLYLWTEERRELSIELARQTVDGPRQLGEYLHNIADESTSIAVLDAGAIAYYSGVPVLDLYGLNNQYIAHLPGKFGNRFDLDYVLNYQPTFVELHYHLTEKGNPLFVDFTPSYRLYYSEEFQRWYERDLAAPLTPFRRLPEPKSQTMMDNFYTAQIHVDHPPSNLAASTTPTLSVQLTNDGTGPWVSAPVMHEGVVYVVTRFVSPVSGQELSSIWTHLPEDVLPGETITMDVRLQTPEVSGSYVLQIDLVLNGMSYFREEGFDPWQHTVLVEAGGEGGLECDGVCSPQYARGHRASYGSALCPHWRAYTLSGKDRPFGFVLLTATAVQMRAGRLRQQDDVLVFALPAPFLPQART